MESLKDDLASWNYVLFLFHFSQGIGAIVLSLILNNILFVPVITDFLSFDTTLDAYSTHINVIGKVNVCLFLSISAWVSAAFHISQYLRYEEFAKELVTKGSNTMRWIYYGISTGIITSCVALLSGIDNVFVQILLWVLTIAIMREGYAMERINGVYTPRKKIDWHPFLFGIFYFFIMWLIIFIYFFEAVSSNGSQIPWFLYTIVPGVMFMYFSFACLVFLQFSGLFAFSDRIFVEKWYMIISLITTTFVIWVLIIGIIVSSFKQV
jgi:hypothetical protein